MQISIIYIVMSVPTINLKVIVLSLLTIALSRTIIQRLSSQSVIISPASLKVAK